MSFNHDNIKKKLCKLTKKQLNKRDIFGRTILHIICITGRFELLKELLLNPNLNITIIDHENGWTGLHTSIYYGKFSCAKILLDFHYDLVKMKDRNSLTALDIYHLKYSYKDLNIFPGFIKQDNSLHFEKRFINEKVSSHHIQKNQSLQWWDSDLRGGSEVYSFGINVNNNLGTGDSVDKLKYPVNLDIPNFRINDMDLPLADRLVKPRIKDIKLSKNHSILLTNEPFNNTLICGNPTRGRLGDKSSTPLYRFTNIEAFKYETISKVAVSEDHSLALNDKGEVYSWGLNSVGQLGYKFDSFSAEPRKISHTSLKRLRIKGISCSKIHSAAFTNNELVLWGLNVGQMDINSSGEVLKVGKFKGIIQSPRKIEFQSIIRQVLATNESTIILLQSNECHILINNNRLKIPLPEYRTKNNEFEKFRPKKFSQRLEIVKICSRKHSNIAILYNDGSVWNFSIDPQTTKNVNGIRFNEIWKPTNDHLKCVDVDIGSDGSVVICTKSGCVFQRGKRSFDSQKAFKFTKVPKISKIVKVSCDELFTSFAFIRDDVDQLPLQLKTNTFKEDIGRLSPLFLAKENAALNITKKLYVMDFSHSGMKKDIDENEDEHVLNLLQTRLTSDEQEQVEEDPDPLLKAYKSRWTKTQTIKDTSCKFQEEDLLISLASEDFEQQYAVNNYNFGKGYNLSFEIDQYSIGAHDSILKFDDQLALLHTQDLTIFEEGIVFHKINNGVIKVDGVDLRSLLILLNVFYTGDLLKPWEVSGVDSSGMELKKTQGTIMKILKKLQIIDDLNRLKFDLINTFQVYEDNFENDLIIKLANDEYIECCSFVLVARNDYFKTLLSARWRGAVKHLEFFEYDKSEFQVILKYIYGTEQLELLNHLQFDSINDFINYIFKLIELVDELLMFELKDFFQLTIKDFINLENVLMILQNSEVLNCQKLSKQCLYFIYHNFDLILMDPQYNEELLTTKTFCSIDEYAHDFNKLNQVTTIISIPWYEDNQLMLISQFLNEDQREFNDIFLEDDNFVPLFDIKHVSDSVQVKTKKERQSSIPSVSSITEQLKPPRKSSMASLLTENLPTSYASFLRDASVGSYNESAIDFNTEDENGFELAVNSRRRRKSSMNMRRNIVSSSSIDLQQPNVTGPVSSSQIMSSSYRNHSSASIISENESQLWPEFSTSSTGGVSSSSSSSSVPWNIPTAANVKSNLEYFQTPNSIVSSSDQTIGPTAKITINRLSQKERRRRLSKTHAATEVSSTVKSNNTPWKLPSISNPTSSVNPQPSLLEIARLEQLKEQKKNRTPSLNGIRHEEEHKIIQEKQTKSLAEIQQEEEFNLWWEAESKRTQQQMKHNSGKDVIKKTMKKKNNFDANNVKSKNNKKKPSSLQLKKPTHTGI